MNAGVAEPSERVERVVIMAKDKPVRIDADLADMVDVILSWRKRKGQRLSVASYLSPMIREQIERDYGQALDEQHREFHARSKKKP